MATIGTSYLDYKNNHPVNAGVEANENGKIISWNTLKIVENIGNGDMDFFDPQKLSTLSQEALNTMEDEMRAISRHAQKIMTNPKIANIVGNYLDPNDRSGAADFINHPNIQREHGNIAIGMLKRDFVEGGMSPDVVKNSIYAALGEFDGAYKAGIKAAWAQKAEMNGLVEELVDDLNEGAIAAKQEYLNSLSPEQQDYFREQFNGWSARQGVNPEVLDEMNGVLDRAFAGEIEVEDPVVRGLRRDRGEADHGHEHGDHSHDHDDTPWIREDGTFDTSGPALDALAEHIITGGIGEHAINGLENHDEYIRSLPDEKLGMLRDLVEQKGHRDSIDSPTVNAIQGAINDIAASEPRTLEEDASIEALDDASYTAKPLPSGGMHV